MTRGRIARRSLLWAVVVGSAVGCGPRATGGVPADGPDPGDVTARLGGAWILTEFTASDPLDPVLSGFLAELVGNLVVDVGPKTFTAQGPAVDIERNYEIVEALFDRAEVAVFDDDGTTYAVAVELRGGELFFACKTSPWRGNGRLVPAGDRASR